MNRVFKVIWNRTKGCYVVVAETAKNMTKRSSLSVVFSKMVGATAVAVMLTGVMMPTDALGAPITRGNGAQAENDGGIAIGDNTASKGDYSISIGTNASVGRGDTDEGKTQSGIAIGQGATVTVDVAKGADVPADQRTGGIAIGQGATTKVVNAIAVGSGTSADGAQAVTIGHNSRSITNNSVALGNETRVASLNGFALGNNARAGYDETNKLIGLPNDQAFGSNARAYGGSSMAFGNDAKSSGGGAVSIGNGSQSRGDWAVAIGNGSKALKQGSSALGTNATTNSSHSTALGWGSTTNGYADIAAGDGSVASGGNSLAIGVQSSTSTGAVGAVALGLSSKAEQTNSMALGVSANAAHERSVALGANSKTDATVSTPNQLVNGLWYKNYAGGSADSTISVGSDTVKRTITNVAAGRVNAQSTDAINGSQLYGVANTLGNLASTTKGILGGNAALDPDTGNLSMSNIGNTGKGTIHDAIKFNKDTIDKGLNFDANTGGTKNNLLGSKVTIKGDGNNINAAITQANGDTTINMTLGNTVTIGAANPVTINGTTGHVTGLQNKDWNVDNPVAVSGRAATEDQLKKVNDKVNTNKAAIDKNAGDINTNKQNITKNAGDIANNKTDIAKNKQDISTINTKINKGLNFAGDTGTVSNRQLGDTVTVKGGATGTLSDGNIGVVSDGNGTLNVKLAKTLTGLDSVTAGNTKIDNGGLTVGGKNYVSTTGLNANNQKITNVADGSSTNDAVNYGQLQAAIGGTAKASTVKAKDVNVTVTESTNAAGGKEYTVGLGNKITVGTAHPVTVDGDAGHVTGLTNTDWNVDNPVAVSGRGATEDQLKAVNEKVNTNKTQIDKNKQDIADNKQNITNNAGNIAQNKQDISNINTKINKGLNFAGDTGNVSNRQLGDTVTVKGGATGTLSDGNIGVVSDGNGTLNVKLAKTLTGLDSVTAGNTKIDSNGLTVGGKTYVSPTGLNANNQKITNVADGTVGAGSKDAVNGGQLHDAKNELTTNINNAKTELINKGLRFNADNNDEKTNKLGSKVTVNGDGNITTEITQTGDDTTIGVKLKKDLNVTTVTATDTVKAGGVTMGKHADTKNYVTGLENKDWDVNKSNPVSGRAATEDQLKKISDVIKSQGAASTDYRLVANPAVADGAYTVDSNGDVDLTVEDKNHAGSKETVKIKDVASKSSLDKLNDRAVKYNLDNNGDVDKTKVTYEGPTYANKTGGTHVTNVAYATGNDGSEAVNVDYLKDKIKDSEDALTNKGLKFDANNGGVKTNKLGSKVTVKGDNSNIITEISQDGNGDSTIDVKLGKNLNVETITATGANGKDGKIGINGKDGVTTNISVTRDGQPGVDGAPGTTTTRIRYQKPDGTNEEVATLNDGLKFKGDMGAISNVKLNKLVNITGGVTNASDLATGNNIGVTSATVDADGNAKLQLQLAKNLTGLQSVTASDTVKAGTVTMGKQEDGANPGNTGNYVSGLDNKDWDIQNPNMVSGRAATEDQLKTVSDEVKKQGANATDFRLAKNAAEADGAYKVDDNGNIDLTVEDKNHPDKKETVKLKDIASKSKLDDVINKGLQFDANSGGVQTNKLGSKITIKGEGTDADNNYSGENLKTFIKQDQNGNTIVDVKMNKNLKAETVKVGKGDKDGVTITGPEGPNGLDGKVGVTGKDGKPAVSMFGKDGVGHIGLTGPAGTNGVNGTNGIDMSVKNGYDDDTKGVKGAKGVDGVDGITRIVYQDKNGEHQVATMDDGMLYGGDTGKVIEKKLNNQVNVKGGISDESKLATEDNIGVVSDGSDTLKLRLAKELKGLTSATFTNGGNNTVINGDGMTINRAGGDAVSLTKDGLNNGGNKITNVADGTDPNDAVNKSQLDKATAAASTTVSAGNNITVTPSTNANGSKNYEVSLKDQVTLGSDATKQIAMDGTTGTIKAGDKVTIDGNKGTIKAGNVTIDGENGTIKAGDKVTIDGKDGKIAAGKVSVDGKDGYVTGLENKDWDPDNITSGRAATEDQLQKSHKSLDNKINNLGDEITKKGMNFAGNTGEFHRDLGQKVTIKGEGTESDDKYSGENIKTVADQDGNVTIKMAKNLKTDSLTTDKVKVGKNGQDGVSITGPNGADGTDGKVGITGKDGKDAVSMSGKDGVGHIGLTGKDGRNADITVDKGDPDLDGNNITRIKYQDENGKTHQVATKDDGMKYGGDSGSVIKKKLNEQVNVVGGITDASKLTTEDNLGVVSDGTGNLKVRMAKDLKGLETVTTKDAAGNTTVMNGGGVTITPASGNAVSLTKDGLNNGGNTITNVGPGVNGTDAVNVNQLKGATDGLANAINSVAGETQRVGAHAAAMSALKPIQYDPLEPTQVMAGIGNYRGETAAALGVAHYTAEDTMFHVGVSVGSHHNMVNAGVTRKFGTSDAKKAVPERYKGGPISSMYVMQDEMTALKAKYEKVQRDNEEMRAQIALLMQQAGLK
ncbi:MULTISPECIES: ESPR-type extended signal peptide-containing protein [Veillonella]|uniref:ESPR-type extended signal peptide-containing protein n=1 Tax=Veillonella TaxID=29465 RepID=UPI0001D096FC|nr:MULTISPECIES: ESPR-type extended signal peptide-containing protein [Veillonella]EFG24616.1 Hep/Hag repeat protein [Veillonella sp. 6_1_27]